MSVASPVQLIPVIVHITMSLDPHLRESKRYIGTRALEEFFGKHDALVSVDKNNKMICMAQKKSMWTVMYEQDHDRCISRTYPHITAAVEDFIKYNRVSDREAVAVYCCHITHTYWKLYNAYGTKYYHCDKNCRSILRLLGDETVTLSKLFKRSRTNLWCALCTPKELSVLLNLWAAVEPVLRYN